MSTTDTMTPLVSAPWFDADGNPLPVRALPGLRPEVVRGLECSYPGIIHPTLRALLETCCGLAATELGVRGWPHGLVGPSGRLYRCGRLPVFAVAGSPSEGWRQEFSAAIPPRAQPPTHCANSGTLDLRPCA